MNEREERKNQLRQRAAESAQRADELLEGELQALLNATRSDLERLLPRVSDTVTYNQLIAAVDEATRRNESLAQLKSRLQQLGRQAVRIGKEAVKLLKVA
jgi:parvulin-like peptidyl-prolyl isomerase